MPSATIVGAGVFGAWTAHALRERGWTVTLVEQHGPAHSRASSGGETRIIRSGYGTLAVYARWASESLVAWHRLAEITGECLFVRTGALFVGRDAGWLDATTATLRAEGIPVETLSPDELAVRFPQLSFTDATRAVFEPEAGVLFARRAVQRLVRSLLASGVRMRTERADPLRLVQEDRADVVIFAAGPWLPSLFPAALGEFIVPTRQEVFFFGAPPGDARFDAASLPAWVAFDEGIYGVPNLEHRGVKVAIDAHGVRVDPETEDRVVDSTAVERMRMLLRRRIPSLADAPLVESRVCQYENTPDGHFVIDRLPGHDRVWIVGGGSGHGFKHGPAVGRYLADLLQAQRAPDPMFALEGRAPRRRAVY